MFCQRDHHRSDVRHSDCIALYMNKTVKCSIHVVLVADFFCLLLFVRLMINRLSMDAFWKWFSDTSTKQHVILSIVSQNLFSFSYPIDLMLRFGATKIPKNSFNSVRHPTQFSQTKILMWCAIAMNVLVISIH